MAALPTPQSSPRVKEMLKIRIEIEEILTKAQNNAKWSPTREQLESCAERLLDYIIRHDASIESIKSYLKAAVIDLTEIPRMAPQMQRIATLTAIKSALHEIDRFLSCL